jgi:hypothetical protein
MRSEGADLPAFRLLSWHLPIAAPCEHRGGAMSR